MENCRLTPESIAPQFEIRKDGETRWGVMDKLVGKLTVEYENGFYHCDCGGSDQDCEHIYSVKQFELIQFDEQISLKKHKAFADMMLWEISQLEMEVVRNNAAADHQIKRITLWREYSNHGLQNKIDQKALLLRNYLEASGKKTEKLVNGIIKLRAQLPTISVNKDEFDIECERFVRIIPAKREPDIKAIRAHLNETGEILPGVEVEFRLDKFSYEISNDLKQGVNHERNEVNSSDVGKTIAA